ncbi:hypothetical protein Nepgr_022340 [Nepenthes gracilis]|uniref:Uncharacterized protein n=1 Tax=Nepenthes gracilis TaxID=150966 RepID=A0AAD3T0J7_NEPGR|nr:hypothetical protein Nepgr_022340 [Nepenthes gracilis]
MATDQSKASVLASDPTLHGLNNSDPAALPDAKLEYKKIEAPVLFRGMAPLLHPVNNLEMKILPVPSSANSANLNPKSLETSNQDVFLEAVVLAQLVENGASNVSLARVPQTSSLDNDDIEGTDGAKTQPQDLKGVSEALQPFDGEVKHCQPLREDAVFQPVEGEERELQLPDGEVRDLQLPEDDNKPHPMGCKSTELPVSKSEGKKLQSLDGLVQELKPLDDKTRDLGPLESVGILDRDAYEVRQFSLITSQCSPALVALNRMHGENEQLHFSQPFGNTNCLSTAEKLQGSVEIYYTQLPPNHKVLLKSVNPSASKLAKHLPDLYGHAPGISSHGQVSSSCTFSHDSTAKLQDACPIPRRVDVMKLTIENGPNFVQLVSYATSSCDLSPGFEMTIRIPDVRTRITLQIKEEIMLRESINGVALLISFSSWWKPHHDRISLPDAIWHFPSLVLLEGCDDVQAAPCYAIRNMMSENDPMHKEIMPSHENRFLHHFKTCPATR